VGLRMARDLAPSPGVIVDAPEIVAVRHGREGAVERQDLESVTGEVEIADDLRPQQRHDVRADRKLESWEDLFGDRGAADDMAPLQHEHFPSRTREIRGGRQTVMAAANDDDVVFHTSYFF